MIDKDTILKKEKIGQLFYDIDDPLFIQYFDIESDDMLDEKISVMEDIISGKNIKDIPNYYEVLGLNSTDHWD